MHSILWRDASAFGKPVCRLGLALRGKSKLTADDLLHAFDNGINFCNWPGASEGAPETDAMCQAIAGLGSQRESLVICVQLAGRTSMEAAGELRSVLAALKTDYIDVVTLYYVEEAEEWDALCAAGGVVSYCHDARRDGVIRRLGITSHQRTLAARAAASGLLDCLMIRYNAAHRGAEREIFPVTDKLGTPVIAYTALRWGALLRPTPDDPRDYRVPGAADWYRFVLDSDSVAVALAAPSNRQELVEDLQLLQVTEKLSGAEYENLVAHGRVHACAKHGGAFPSTAPVTTK